MDQKNINDQLKIIQSLADVIMGTSKSKIEQIAVEVTQKEIQKVKNEISNIVSTKIKETEEKISNISNKIIEDTLKKLSEIKKEIGNRVTSVDLERLRTQFQNVLKEQNTKLNSEFDDIKEYLDEALKEIDDKIKKHIEDEWNNFKNEMNIMINNIERDMERYKVEWMSSIEKKIFEVKESMRRAAHALLNIESIPSSRDKEESPQETNHKEDIENNSSNSNQNKTPPKKGIIKDPSQIPFNTNAAKPVKTIPKNPGGK